MTREWERGVGVVRMRAHDGHAAKRDDVPLLEIPHCEVEALSNISRIEPGESVRGYLGLAGPPELVLRRCAESIADGGGKNSEALFERRGRPEASADGSTCWR